MKKQLLILSMCMAIFLLSACSTEHSGISGTSESTDSMEGTAANPSFTQSEEDASSSDSFQSSGTSAAVSSQKTVSSQESKESLGNNQDGQTQTSGEKPEVPVRTTNQVSEKPTQAQTGPEHTAPEHPAETKPEQKTEPNTTQPPVPPFDVSGYISAAKSYGKSIGLKLDSTATACWDNPIYANADSLHIRRDLEDALNWYKDSGFTAFWIWSENLGNNAFDIYIGYA